MTRFKEEGAGAWLRQFVKLALSSNAYAVGTLVRAGDYLLRQGQTEQAAAIAKYVVPECKGLLSAYGLAVRCALLQKDKAWAQACALEGIEHARDPVFFYKIIVFMKAGTDSADIDFLTALEYLRENLPEQKVWVEILGQSYFEKGDTQRARAMFSEIMSKDIKGVRIESLLMASEAARIQGDARAAVGLLDAAYALYPRQVSVLNNLIYNLAQSPVTLPRARQLLPGLLELEDSSYAVLDTAAVVYLKSGDLDRADAYITKALAAVEGDSYGALESRLSAAEIAYRRGRTDQALKHLSVIQSTAEVPEIVETGTRELMRKIRELQR